MAIQPVLSPARYAIERAICDKANAYAAQFVKPNGWTIIPAEAATHPDYAACDNDMRGRVEQFEILRDLPEKLTAYVGYRDSNASAGLPLTVWTGLQIGDCTLVAHHGGRWKFDRTYQCYANIAGREYTGRTHGVGMYVNLRETAASKRARNAAADAAA